MLKKFLLRWWPTSIVVCVILYATLNDDPVGADELPAIPYLDKYIHAIMFGGLFSALCFDYYRAGKSLTTRIKLIFAVATAISGGLDELWQGALENGRAAELLDFAADSAGIIIAYFTAPPVIKRVLRKHHQSGTPTRRSV